MGELMQRRARGRPGGDPGRRAAPRAGLPGVRGRPRHALVNPVLEWASEEREIKEEGCLSLPGVHVEVERPARVRVRARDAYGEELVVEAEGLTARVIQHEMDHLDGVLILDRISREARRDAMRALREAREAGDARARRERSSAARSDGAPLAVGACGALAHRLPRHLRVRGSSARAAGRERPPPAAGADPPRPPARARAAGWRAPPVAEAARALGIALEQPRARQRPRGARR